ncbi:serine hydrolase domain-containing protein [Xanthocytophaga agilis]|uniref:Beta-lactamase n=1 Tax=Xanthocytophaga agilis TaxID=3048010 RepID=A0AAE3R1R0_9BACT|nr:serine hydrolase domain-containing protein [Xanthocytophaga agilis]MDJ1499719.1 serine hydrolase domain-containing protein [Xanthocytophaga agilis]
MKTYLISILLLANCLGCKEDATQPIVTNNPLTSSLDQTVHSTVEKYASASSTGGFVIGIFRNDSTFIYRYGHSNKETHQLPDENTIFEIGSISKTFTAALMTDFTASRQINLEEPASKFLPLSFLEKNGIQVKLKDLLNHSSGLPRLPDDLANGANTQEPYKHYDSTKVYVYLKNKPLKNTPETVFEYSNLAFGVAGLILERNTGKSYEQLVEEKIAISLGMKDTKITLSEDEKLRFAKGYDAKGKPVAYWNDLNGFKGAGALRSTVKDLLVYAQANINPGNNTIGKSFAFCHQITSTLDDKKVGLAWFELTINGHAVYVHDGGTGGFTSFILFSKEKKRALVLLANNSTENLSSVIDRLSKSVF